MKNLSCILWIIVLFSCNPYEQYFYSHYYIQAEMDPGSARFSANLQMVFVARQEYKDSICFHLNPELRIQSLASQELEHYIFRESDSGRLVLFLEDPVGPNERIHISMSYSGRLSGNRVMQMDSSICWYPVNEDSHPCTYMVKFALPGSWQVSQPDAATGQHGKWLIQSREPQNSIDISITPR